MKRIAPSILSADFGRLKEEVQAVEAAGADYIHIDVMDGHFVPNITIGPVVVEAVRKITKIPLDVHLMIENPDRYIPDFAKAGADILAVHVETCPHLHRTVTLIREHSVKPAVVINPSTPVSFLDPDTGRGGYGLNHERQSRIRGPEIYPRCREKDSNPQTDDYR